MILLVLLGGCARSSVLLLPGENGAPQGAVAVIDESGGDRVVLARENERARLSAGRVAGKVVDERSISTRDRRLLEDIPPPPSRFVLNFLEDSVQLTPESEPQLKALLAEVRRRDGADVVVIGHTDTLGTIEDNDALSRKRAEEIRTVLIAQGLDPQSTRAAGRGERDPLVASGDGVRMAANRRVEVVVR